MTDHLQELESELNKLLWHIRVCQESDSTPCLNVVKQHVINAKHHFNLYDNREVI